MMPKNKTGKRAVSARSAGRKKSDTTRAAKEETIRRRQQRLRTFRHRLHTESINSLTHGVGVGITLSGTALLLATSIGHNDATRIASAAIYGVCMTMVFVASMLYHSMMRPKAKRFFLLMDHSAIFLAIAGTYTPICLLLLGGLVGTAMLFAIWLLAVAGIVFKTRFINRFQFLSTLIYVVMGWSILLTIRSFSAAMPLTGLILFFTGGGMYTLGTLFYGWRRLPYHHMIWHLFVLAGAILHYLSLYLFVFQKTG